MSKYEGAAEAQARRREVDERPAVLQRWIFRLVGGVNRQFVLCLVVWRFGVGALVPRGTHGGVSKGGARRACDVDVGTLKMTAGAMSEKDAHAFLDGLRANRAVGLVGFCVPVCGHHPSRDAAPAAQAQVPAGQEDHVRGRLPA